MGTSVFTTFDASDDITTAPSQVTTGLWSGNTGSLTQFYLGAQSASLSGQYFFNVYNQNTTSSTAAVQFAVSYGHRLGGGNQSLTVNNNATLSTEVEYDRYRNILLDSGETQFEFSGNYFTDQIYIINIERAQLRQDLNVGNWSINLSGSNGNFTFIDDSGLTLNSTVTSGNVYNIVSGSLTGISGSTIVASASAASGGFGLVYPSLGIMVFNCDAISSTIGMISASYAVSASKPFAPNTDTNTIEYNHVGFYNAITLGADFQARSAEIISSTYYSVMLPAGSFNYSNNPSYYNLTNGNLNIPSFVNNPTTFPTTIGLYNPQNELLAVAKLSSPIPKTNTTAQLISVRIDY